MSRIDKTFCSSTWENLYANPALQALSSSTLDHCPLLLTSFISPQTTPRFRFESFWVNILGFHNVVSEAWNKPATLYLNHMLPLHIKLGRAAKALKAWSKKLMPHAKLSMAIHQQERAQEKRSLSDREQNLINCLKQRLLGMAVVEKSRA
jgi:hypothetical protein